jgi:hypothetical protein
VGVPVGTGDDGVALHHYVAGAGWLTCHMHATGRKNEATSLPSQCQGGYCQQGHTNNELIQPTQHAMDPLEYWL